jgi:hypothetical protein
VLQQLRYVGLIAFFDSVHHLIKEDVSDTGSVSVLGKGVGETVVSVKRALTLITG